jgi:hypothetical protein
MHRAGFPKKAGPEFLKQPIGVHQYPMKLLHLALIVRRVMIINIVWSEVIEFCRLSLDLQFDSEHLEGCHIFPIKVRHGPRVQPDDVFPPIAHLQNEAMKNEIEIDDKRAAAVGNRGSRQADGRDVKRHIPPVILPAFTRHSRLPHDLSPHVNGVTRFLPVGEWEDWPVS